MDITTIVISDLQPEYHQEQLETLIGVSPPVQALVEDRSDSLN